VVETDQEWSARLRIDHPGDRGNGAEVEDALVPFCNRSPEAAWGGQGSEPVVANPMFMV
jgi:hypothetical protein